MGGSNQTITLMVNGAHLAEVDADDPGGLDRPLRGLAVAASPILLQGPAAARRHVAERLRALGPRADLPLRTCRTPTEADPLLSSGEEAAPIPSGTWILDDVGAWPTDAQGRLVRALERVDAGRLLGELGPRQLPRVIVELPESPTSPLGDDVLRRLGFFKIQISARAS